MNPSTRKFFDVAHPGQAAPSATSRSVVSRPLQPDPMLGVSRPNPVPTPAPAVQPPVTDPAPAIDPQALLIQAGQWNPPKASHDQSRRIVLIVMCVTLVVVCAASYWLVSTM